MKVRFYGDNKIDNGTIYRINWQNNGFASNAGKKHNYSKKIINLAETYHWQL